MSMNLRVCCGNEKCAIFSNCNDCWRDYVATHRISNGDLVRLMDDEKLAKLIHNGISSDSCDYCEHNGGYCDGSPCRGKTETEIIAEWLRQPMKEGAEWAKLL